MPNIRAVTLRQSVPLLGSHKHAPLATIVQDELHGRRKIEFSIQTPTSLSESQIADLVASVHSGLRSPLSPEELEAVLGAKPTDLQKIMSVAKAAGLSMLPRTDADRTHGIVRVKGTYSAAKRFLPGLKLSLYEDEDGKRFYGRQGSINVKGGLPIEGIFGLDDRTAAQTGYVLNATFGALATLGTARDVAAAQGVPVDQLTGLKVGTAYISLGGDNGPQMQIGLKKAAAACGITAAKIITISVDGAAVKGDPQDDATWENALDMQAHALLHGGYVAVFVANNDDDSFARAAETANSYAGAKINGRVVPLSGYSISWGSAESQNTLQSLQRWQRIAVAARLRGLIVTAATGDDGAKDRTANDTPDAPSCVPGIIGAAGVELNIAGGKVTEVTVWNDLDTGGGATGGGVSSNFPPAPEELALGLGYVLISNVTGKPGHGSSTIADDAAPASGPMVYGYESQMQVGGTSNAAPVICAKLAALQGLLRHPIPDPIAFIYEHAKEGIFTQVNQPGNNGDYSVQPGDLWSIVTGFGVINWDRFFQVAKRVQDGTT